MQHRVSITGLLGLGAAIWASTAVVVATTPPQVPGAAASVTTFSDASGSFQTVDVNGPIDLTNPFFQSLGTNGRACVTCHQPSDAWTVTPDHIRARFNATAGLDPIFRTNDGSVSPEADVSTVTARRA